ncbi:MAG TPA: hypothetical protein ENN05_11250 [Deltaproteobacteria bacterium]|nr:hypothetical protein [Deltaproteobacteria bacterium]
MIQKHRIALSISCVIFFLLSGCASTQETFSHTITVAVWDMENLSYEDSSRPDLGQILSAEIIESLRNSGGYQVVERQKLMLVLEELNLGSSDLADEGSRLRIGRIAGAACMVFGGYQVIGSAMRIDLRLVDVSTGRIVRASQKTASSSGMAQWLSAARDAASELSMK